MNNRSLGIQKCFQLAGMAVAAFTVKIQCRFSIVVFYRPVNALLYQKFHDLKIDIEPEEGTVKDGISLIVPCVDVRAAVEQKLERLQFGHIAAGQSQ